MDREDKNTLMIINEASQDFIFVHVSLNMISKNILEKSFTKSLNAMLLQHFIFVLCRIMCCVSMMISEKSFYDFYCLPNVEMFQNVDIKL